MSRLLAVLLACLFSAAPSADLVCRASCTPVETVAPSVPSCHDVARDLERDRIVSTVSCQRDVPPLLARAADVRRDIAAPYALTATVPAFPSAAARLSVRRPHDWFARPRARQAFPPCIVLRV